MSIITHQVNSVVIGQRPEDGYFNLTAMVRADGKLIADYLRLESTNSFLSELSGSMGIPIDLLVVKKMTGSNSQRGTWAHPQVAIHCAQWCSPKFAVMVTKWVFDWMAKGKTPELAPMPESIIEREPIESDELPEVDDSIHPELVFFKQVIDLGDKLGGFDDNQRLMLKSRLVTTVLNVGQPFPSGAPTELSPTVSPSVPANAPVPSPSTPDHQRITVAARARLLGYSPTNKQMIIIGQKAARLYRARYGSIPLKEEALVNGVVCLVSVYHLKDLAMVDTAIHAVMGAKR